MAYHSFLIWVDSGAQFLRVCRATKSLSEKSSPLWASRFSTGMMLENVIERQQHSNAGPDSEKRMTQMFN